MDELMFNQNKYTLIFHKAEGEHMYIQNIPFIPQFKLKLVEFSHLENGSILIMVGTNHFFSQF